MKRVSDIELRLLRVFKAIVDGGGLVGAQSSLNLSQSTVSTQLSELEQRLGYRLCYRSRSGFSLTKAGRQTYDACVDLFSAADRFQNTTASISGELKGVLRIGTADAMLSNQVWDLPEIIRVFNERAKAAVIELSLDSPGDMERHIIEGTRDLSVGPFNRRTLGVTYMPLYRERHALFCAEGHPLAARTAVSLAEIRQHAFVARRYLHRLDLERIGHVNAAAVVDQMESQALLIQSGRFVGYLPVHMVEMLKHRRAFRRVQSETDVDFFSPFFLIYRASAEESLLIRSFINRVREVALPAGPEDGSASIIAPAKAEKKPDRNGTAAIMKTRTARSSA